MNGPDDSQLIGTLSLRLKEKEELRKEVETLRYELTRLEGSNSANIALLKEIRKRMFWRNDMELVKLIDERIPNV